MSHGSSATCDEDVCVPFKTLEDVRNWKPGEKTKHFAEILPERIFRSHLPRTLICHDMKGGYLEDRYLHGVKTNDDCYFFIHWSMIDVFVYFSHNFITIPPCGWISAAHKNETKILGTFITEWDLGSKLCEEFLADENSVHELCNQLVHIAVFHNFDGWLINIENKLQPHQVPLLEEFVSFLTKSMHREKSDSLVIWYDSIITSGDLKWQNALNENNRNFFDACDGIFLNYNWKVDHLQKSFKEAGSRTLDVYVGVDVFGRGCLGGGGFSSNIAVQAARDFGLSVAIFAPGWVYECLDTKDFVENQYKFWDSLTELCLHKAVTTFPYSTTFCPGFGKKMFRQGKVISDESWFNIGLQEPQPSYHYSQCTPPGGCISISTDDAYSGGGCLKLTHAPCSDGTSSIEFLSTHLMLKTNCIINYTFKALSDRTDLSLHLAMRSVEHLYAINLGSSHSHEECDSKEKPSIEEYSEVKERELISLDCCEELLENGWISRSYMLKAHKYLNEMIKSITAKISCHSTKDEQIVVLLGQLQILPMTLENELSVIDFEVVKPIKDDVCIRCRLEWGQLSFVRSWDLFYKIGEAERYIDTSYQSIYKIKDLKLHRNLVKAAPGVTFEIEFLLYPQSMNQEAIGTVSHKLQYQLLEDHFS